MRLFFALCFAPEACRAIREVQRRLRALAGPGNYTRPENLHLTLAFLGEQPPEGLSAARRALAKAAAPPLSLTFDRLGRFRQEGEALWWIGLSETPALTALYTSLWDALEREGFPRERRPFRPHLTLARRLPADLRAEETQLLPAPIPAETAGLHLMESLRLDGRLVYRPQASR